MDINAWLPLGKLLLFFIASALLSCGLLLLFISRKQPDPGQHSVGESLFLAGIFYLLALAVAATLLTVFHIFSGLALCLAIAFLGALVWLWLYRHWPAGILRKTAKLILTWRPAIGVTCLLAVAALLYGLFPTQYLFGGRDYGLYYINAIHIAEAGSMQYESDSFIDENYAELESFIKPGYPALFSAYDLGISEAPGKLDPQFLPMFPSLLAVGYTLAGLRGLLRMNTLISLFSILALYYIAKRFFGIKAAILAATFLAINPAQLFGARITQSEMLAQLLFLVCCYLISLGWRSADHRIFLTLGGVLVGVSCFCRIDNYLIGIGLYAITCYCALWKREILQPVLRGCLACTALMALSVWYGFTYHYYYFYDHFWGHKVLLLLLAGTCIAFTLTLLCLGIGKHAAAKGTSFKNPIAAYATNRWGAGIVAGVLALSMLAACFIQPLLRTGLDGHALREFGWYIGFVCYPLAIFGGYRMLRKNRGQYADCIEPLLFLLCTGLACLYMYTVNPGISWDHIWAGRRWVPINYPFVLLFAAYGITEMPCLTASASGKHWLKLTSSLLAVGVTGYMLYQCRAALFTVQLQGIDQQYAMVAAAIPEDAVVFTRNANVASVFKVVYGKQVYLVQDHDAIDYTAFQHFVEQSEQEVYWMGDTTELRFYFDGGNSPAIEGAITGEFVRPTIGTYPGDTIVMAEDVACWRLAPRGPAATIDLLADFGTILLEENHSSSYTVTAAGLATFGPYYSLPAGTYSIALDIEVGAELLQGLEVMQYDYTLETDRVFAIFEDLQPGLNELTFTLGEDIVLAELRLYTAGEGLLDISEYTLSAVG